MKIIDLVRGSKILGRNIPVYDNDPSSPSVSDIWLIRDYILSPGGTLTKSVNNPLFTHATYTSLIAPSPYYDEISNKFYLVCAAYDGVAYQNILIWSCPGNSDPTIIANWTGPTKILGIGASGWDSSSVDAPSLTRDSNGIWYLYYTGLQSGIRKIGYATCPNGADPTLSASWTKYASNPVLSGSGSGFDITNVCNPILFKDGSTWYMLYSGADNSLTNWKIGLASATTPAGPWARVTGPIVSNDTNKSWKYSHVYPAGISKINSYYYLFVLGANNTNTSLGGIGLVQTTNLTTGWVDSSLTQPRIGIGAAGQWDDYSIQGGGMIYKGDKYYIFYSARISTGLYKIGCASIPRK